MRLTLAQGASVQRYVCRFCGQAEMLTEGEETNCSNCGQPLELITTDMKLVTFDAIEPKAEEAPKVKKKPGRKPKPKTGTCGTCEKALKAEFNYTCKETCEMVYGDDLACKHYKNGVPVGERPGATYSGNENSSKGVKV